ncbi:diguanylate cyclase/phosphodiesterase (GGDEF & EAL domains) with PAS/PAC sensor(s) [hydrothermal vent metagenome]|uniref:histidine kinase n=1 Tax=hydrothermal vent metagenome TaxID=652676 RepID=A0A3B0RKY4_9ZZZZ
MTLNNKNSIKNMYMEKAIVLPFFILFFFVAVIFAALLYSFYLHDISFDKKVAELKERNVIAFQQEYLDDAFSDIVSDLMVVAGHYEVGAVLSGDVEAKEALVQEFLLFSRRKEGYVQIRLIDKTGKEVVRVDRQGFVSRVVPEKELQNKAHRYYFKQGMELSAGRVYFSPIDLNIEHEKIEEPYQPVLRVVTPVYDSEAEKRGIVVLNYSANTFIDHFKEYQRVSGGSLMLLNSDGYWLLGGREGDDFAFAFKGKEARSFASDFPEAWQSIKWANLGQFVTGKGLFTFDSINPNMENLYQYRAVRGEGVLVIDSERKSKHVRDQYVPTGENANYLNLVSYVPAEVYNAYGNKLFNNLLIVYAIMLLILAIALWAYGAIKVRRRNVEASLVDSERRFHAMMDNSTAVISVKDIDGRYTFVNKVFEDVFNVEGEFVRGKNDHEVFPRVMADVLRANDKLVIKKKTPVEFEEVALQTGGRHTYLSVRFPLLGDGGEPYAICAMSTDITARKEAEEEFRKSRQKLALHVEQTPLAVIEWNTDFEVIGWNPAAERIFGYSAAEAMGRHGAGLLVSERDRSRVDMVWLDLMAHRGGRRSTNENVTKDGTLIVCDWYNTPLVDSMGLVIGVSSLVMDITERKRAQEALEASRKMLLTVLDTIPVRVFWKDRDLKYIGCNINFARDAGFESPVDVIGLDDYQMSWKKEAERYRFDDTAVMESGEGKLNYEEPQSRSDGTELWRSTSKIPLRDLGGNIFGVLGTYSDITERKQTEKALETLYKSTGDILGQEFFDGVVESIYEWLGADCVVVGERYDTDNIRVISMKLDNDKVVGVSYALPGTPCAKVIDTQKICIYPENVAALFPYDEILKEMGAVGYVGAVLRGKDGTSIGVLSILTKTKLVLPPNAEAVVELVAARAAAELERMRAEQEVLKVNRSLKAVSQCSEALVHASNEADLLREICRIIIDTGGYRMVWVGYLEQDADKTVRPVARAGFDVGYVDSLKISWGDNEDGQGPTGTAIRTKKCSVARNLSTDPRFIPWREEAAKRGYNSSISLPLISGDDVLGALNIYASEVDAFNAEETSLIMELVNDLAYGIVTLRTRGEHRKAESAATYLGRILEDSLNEIYIFDAETLKFLQVNRGGRDNIGYSMDELRDITPVDIKPEMLRAGFMKCLEPLRSGEKEKVQFKTIHRRKDGTTYPVDVYLQLSAFESKPVFVGIILDITERVKAEQEVRRLNESLERQVVERTSELSLVNKELEAFAYSVSHDLRAPLRGIDGFSQALSEDYGDKLDDDAQNYLRRIRSATQHMSELINDMLSLSRVTRSELRRETFDMTALAGKVVASLRKSMPERVVEVVVEQGLVVEGADSHLVRVVLENLLGNAWKFTGKKDNAKIEFGRKIIDDERVFYVKDNGAGFDMEYAGKLFGAFQRLHSIDEFEGTGIGLATVQRIVHRHGGRIWAKAEPGLGAVFYFTLS